MEDLKVIYEKFNKLKDTSSRLEKEELLRNFDDDLFRKTLNFLLSPYIVTNIGGAKLKKFSLNQGTRHITSFEDYIDFLSNEVNGKQASVDVVMEYVNEQPEEYRDFLMELCTKKFKLGLTSKTVNKVYGEDIIPSFDIMLAHSYHEHGDKIDGEFIITNKLNGCRMIAIVDEHGVQLFSRQGKIMTGLIEIKNELVAYPYGVYDGEILAIGEFKDSDACYKETIKRSRIKGVKSGLKYVMYDYLTLDEFKFQKSDTPCIERKTRLMDIVSEHKMRFTEYLKPLYIGDDTSRIMELCETMTNEGEEGIMVNNSYASYQFKRTSDILKVKLFSEGDVLVTEVLEGEGRLKGKMGKVKINYMIDGEEYSCYCGSGFNDHDREYYWEHQDEILNKIMVVSYKGVTSNENGGYGLQFPVYKSIRDDKEGLEDTHIE